MTFEEKEKVLRQFKEEWHAREKILKEYQTFLEEHDLLLEGPIADRIKKLYVDVVFKGVAPVSAFIVLARAALGYGPVTLASLAASPEQFQKLGEQVEQMSSEEIDTLKVDLVQKLRQSHSPAATEVKKVVSSPITPPIETKNSESDSLINDLIVHEGKKDVRYKDSLGNWTIGVGFNLERGDARSVLKGIGADYDSVMKGGKLTDEQIRKLLEVNIKEARDGIKKELGINLEEYPEKAQHVLINLVFNMGVGGVKKFKVFLSRFKEKKWKGAADALQYRNITTKELTPWFTQVTNGRKTVEEARKANPKNRAVQILDTLRGM